MELVLAERFALHKLSVPPRSKVEPAGKMPSKNAIRACPICTNAKVDLLHHQKFVQPEGHILPDEYDVVWCARCGFAYADTPSTQEDYDRYYADFSKYEDNTTSTGGGGSTWDSYRLKETAASIDQVVANRQACVVDIGCANGGLLAELKERGFTNLLGIDPSPACVANASESHGIESMVGSFRQLPSDVGKFDLVIVSHVLEHVADLQSTVTDLTKLLQPGGVLYVEVPDASRYFECLVAPFQDFNTEHINHFALSSLRNLFLTHGFLFEAGGQKEIPTLHGCPYPAAFCFFRRGLAEAETKEGSRYEVDDSFRRGLGEYIDASRRKLRTLEERLAPYGLKRKPLMVWGTGQLTMKLLAETSLGTAEIVAFIDGNPINQGKEFNHVRVIAPEEITDHATPILLATLLHEKAILDVIHEKLHLPNAVITLGG
jgi:SAM-dependent methyltransferase